MRPPDTASQPLRDLHEALDAIRELTNPWVPPMAQARLESRLMDAADAGRDLEQAAERRARDEAEGDCVCGYGLPGFPFTAQIHCPEHNQ